MTRTRPRQSRRCVEIASVITAAVISHRFSGRSMARCDASRAIGSASVSSDATLARFGDVASPLRITPLWPPESQSGSCWLTWMPTFRAALAVDLVTRATSS